jgi:hypothetical protein
MSYDDERNRIWEERARKTSDRAYSSVTYHPWRWFWGIIIVLFVVLPIISFAFGWVGDWGKSAVDKTRPAHAGPEVTRVLTLWEGLPQAAQNYCSATGATAENPNPPKKPKSSDDPVLVEDPGLAYAATYRSQEREYDRRMENFFEAYITRKVPIPGTIHNLPRRAPSLTEAIRANC